MQTLTQPTLLLKPFAESGDKNTIPVTNTDASNPQLADLTNGFPQITSKIPANNGLPPGRKDFNGLGYLTTTYDYFAQAGGTYTFNQTVSDAIGGYPEGARLWYTPASGETMIVRSLIQNNTYNFNTDPSYIDGVKWKVDTPTLDGNNTWTGTNTFSNDVIFSDDVSLGSKATATTQTSSDNSTKVATTAYVQSRVCTTKATTTSTASSNKPAYIVENYKNTTEWYRVWSDGWKEQGGYISANKTVTFLKPFSDTNYNISLTDKTYGINGNQKTSITSYTSTNMVLSAQNQTGCWWSCCGY